MATSTRRRSSTSSTSSGSSGASSTPDLADELDGADKSTPDLAAELGTGDQAPKRGRGRPKGSTTRTSKALPADFNRRVAEMYVGIGFAVGLVTRDSRDAAAFVTHAEEAGDAWARFAASSPAARAFIERLMAGTGVAAVVAVHGRIGLEIAQNHGVKMPWEQQPVKGVEQSADVDPAQQGAAESGPWAAASTP